MAKLLAIGVFLPGLLVGAILLAAWWRQGNRRMSQAVAGAAIGTALIVSFLVVEGWPGVPPHARWQWLPFIVAAAGVIGFACVMIGGIGAWLAGPLCALALLAMFQSPPMEQAWLWKLVAAIGALVLYATMESYAHRRQGFMLPLALAIAFTATSIIIMEARFSKLSLLAASLAAAMAATVLVAIFRPQLSLATSGVAAVSTAAAAMITIGRLYADAGLPLAALLLAAIAPLGVWCGELPITRRRCLRVMVGITTVIALAAAAVLVAMVASPEQAYEYDYY
jgi:hypothetical protein